MEDKSVTPKVSRMQSAKAAAHQRGLILRLLTINPIWKSAEYHGMRYAQATFYMEDVYRPTGSVDFHALSRTIFFNQMIFLDK